MYHSGWKEPTLLEKFLVKQPKELLKLLKRLGMKVVIAEDNQNFFIEEDK